MYGANAMREEKLRDEENWRLDDGIAIVTEWQNKKLSETRAGGGELVLIYHKRHASGVGTNQSHVLRWREEEWGWRIGNG